MAIPHLNVAIITRSQGQSPVAAASYRSGEALYNELENKLHDYTRKQDVIHTEILAPDHAPQWVFDRARLWNEVQNTEKRKDARFARSLTIALPRELSMEQNTVLIASFAKENFVSHGMIADLAIHNAAASDGDKNPHAHIMLTLRDVSTDGFGKKNREWDNVKCLESWRDAWERCVNRSMEQAGVDERISMKSYEGQGIDKIPTKHLGPDAWIAEQQGVETHVGDDNRRIKHLNTLREILKSEWGEHALSSTMLTPTGLVPVPQKEPYSPQQSVLNSLAAESSNTGETAGLEFDQTQITDQSAPESDPLEQHRRSQHAAQVTLAAETKGHLSGDESSQVDTERAEHMAMLHESPLEHDVITREQKIRMNIIRQYADLLTERAAKIFRAAARQFKRLQQETIELREIGHSYER